MYNYVQRYITLKERCTASFGKLAFVCTVACIFNPSLAYCDEKRPAQWLLGFLILATCCSFYARTRRRRRFAPSSGELMHNTEIYLKKDIVFCWSSQCNQSLDTAQFTQLNCNRGKPILFLVKTLPSDCKELPLLRQSMVLYFICTFGLPRPNSPVYVCIYVCMHMCMCVSVLCSYLYFFMLLQKIKI